MHRHRQQEALEGTNRIEAFSDGVVAIIVTILILEIHVPELDAVTNAGALHALVPLLPKLTAFLVSFITVAIFWVNHHHFFHALPKSNGALLWYNNHLLFWLAVVPFATAFLGDYPTLPVVVALYGFVLFMAALAFALMIRFVFFKSSLLPETVTVKVRQWQFRRSLIGVALYGGSAVLAFVHPYVSLAVFVIVPLFYFFPQMIGGQE
ncbi:MAG: DUF1211 domain-containing protein [Candidatus Doudnabacteria bacterium]|nr:DUF1211 domain-containing protein [Candidatus Doudnabacteria bacterium]